MENKELIAVADARLVQMSKLLSLILRHKPDAFGIELDAEGFAAIGDVLFAVRKRFPDATEADFRSIVDSVEREKQRFTIVENEIRANYGHSISERIVHERVPPPNVLLHGTTTRAATIIRQDGLLPMNRQYVHLTTNRDLAVRVASRRGVADVLSIDAARAHAEGVAFYRANESFWLADSIPTKYILP